MVMVDGETLNVDVGTVMEILILVEIIMDPAPFVMDIPSPSVNVAPVTPVPVPIKSSPLDSAGKSLVTMVLKLGNPLDPSGAAKKVFVD